MPSRPSRREPASSFFEQARALAWGAWSELGVSGWTRSHGDWAIDPEPLIFFTAMLGDSDPRLRDEAIDWSIRYWRFVSKARLKSLSARWADPDGYGEFAATVSKHGGVSWPSATVPLRYTVTGRSELPDLHRPSLVWLRLRAIFGLSARTEILRFFLTSSGRSASVLVIAGAVGYSKRTVAEECEMLRRGGVLAARQVRNRLYYSLAAADELRAFVGQIPEHCPDWRALLTVAGRLVLLEKEVESSPPRTIPVRVAAALEEVEDEFSDLGIVPPDVVGEDLWPAVRAMGRNTLGAWSLGRWHESSSSSVSVRSLTRP